KAWAAPTYDLRHFEVRGNTVLKAEEIDGIIGPLAGRPVSEEQIQRALGKLQEAYRARGHTRATVRLPQQVLTDGTVAIAIHEGKRLEAETASLGRTPAAPSP